MLARHNNAGRFVARPRGPPVRGGLRPSRGGNETQKVTPTSGHKILIVDDEEDILRSTQMLLRVMGYQCTTLRDASRTVEVAAQEHPDLILQDLKMPGFDLESFLHDLRGDARTQDIPFAFFSASPTVSAEATLREAQGYLSKPFRPEDLAALLQRTLGKPAAPRRPAA